MKKILITGGAGFIGSNLIKYLLDDGNYVICLDNFFTGKKSNLIDYLNNKNFETLEHDIIKPIDIQVDEIYNLACPASPIHYQYDPIQTTKTSIFGTINLLDLAYKYNAKYLLASTSEIYGDPLQHPQNENYWGNVNPNGIRSCYDEGKRCAESLTFDYHRVHKLLIKISRIFNTYGPFMSKDDGRVVSNFIVNAILNKDIEIYGDGFQTRSFCYVDDLVNGLIKLMNSNDDFKGPVNLGNNIEFNIIELAEKVLKMTGSKSKLIFKDLPQDDPKQRKPDINLAFKELNWKPKVELEEGLEKTISYFRSIIS